MGYTKVVLVSFVIMVVFFGWLIFNGWLWSYGPDGWRPLGPMVTSTILPVFIAAIIADIREGRKP